MQIVSIPYLISVFVVTLVVLARVNADCKYTIPYLCICCGDDDDDGGGGGGGGGVDDDDNDLVYWFIGV